MSSLISEFFEVLVATTFAYVVHRLTGAPLLEVATYMTLGYVVLINARCRKS